jgi:hypothetical protein
VQRRGGLSLCLCADTDQVALDGDQAAIVQFPDRSFVDGGADELEQSNILGQGALGNDQLLADVSRLFLCDL